MSLRLKFAILVLILAVAVSGSMAVALWSFGLQQSQVLGPYEKTPKIVDELRLLQRQIDAQQNILSEVVAGTSPVPIEPTGDAPPEPPTPPLVRFNEHSDAVASRMVKLNALGVTNPGASSITTRSLVEKVDMLQHQGRIAVERSDPDLAQDQINLCSEISNITSNLSNRLILECVKAIEAVQTIRRELVFSVFWAFTAATLAGALSLVLVHRWVLRPVAVLRTAANQIAQGDFEHRVAVVGKDEISQLGQDVNYMASTIQRMLKERVERERLAAVGEMVRRLAHNLRNPLAGIRGLAELTRDELPGSSDLRDAQERIIGSVDRFEKWLKDLLSATRPTTVNLEKRAIEPMLQGVVEAHRPLARTKAITMELETAKSPVEAYFDSRHLEHTVVAILTNAIQASPQGGTVRITAKQDGPEAWELRIADQGPGVPPELEEKIFAAYFTTKKDGNGIGLAVAQQVVRAHQGTITIEPGIGQANEKSIGPGAAFVIKLLIRPSGDVEDESITTPVGSVNGTEGRHGGTSADHRG